MKNCITFFTGQSNPTSIALSPVQMDFLKTVQTYDGNKLYRNFPYEIPHLPDALLFREVNLLTASLNNSWQYLASRRARYIRDYRESFLEYFKDAEHLLLLAGSCGLELFINLSLPTSFLSKVSIFAYGTVARKIPACRVKTVRGRSDWIAALWQLPVDHTIESGHMDYLQNPETMTLLHEFMQNTGFPLSERI